MNAPNPSSPTATPDAGAGHAPVWRQGARGARRRWLRAGDADEHAHNLTDWQQRYDQLGCGRFDGRLHELQLPQMQVFVEYTSHAVRQQCRVWDDALWLGLAADAQAPAVRLNGQRHPRPGALTRPGGTTFELVTPDAHTIYGLVVRRPWLQAAAEAQGCAIDWQRLAQAEHLPMGERMHTLWQHTLRQLLAEAPDGAAGAPHSADARTEAPLQAPCDPLSDPVQAAHQQDLLLCLLLGLLDHAEVDAGLRSSHARRRALVARAEALVLAQPEAPPSVPEVCAALHVSRRTLQYCFEAVLGLSPLQALRTMRLNGVRRALRQAAAHGPGAAQAQVQVQVQDLAAQWGFWHVSQFSADYRRLFGISPSHTLQTAAQG